jgi:hypothetical protein
MNNLLMQLRKTGARPGPRRYVSQYVNKYVLQYENITLSFTLFFSLASLFSSSTLSLLSLLGPFGQSDTLENFLIDRGGITPETQS